MQEFVGDLTYIFAKFLQKIFCSLRTLPHCHPNIVKMYKAFIDRMPIFEEAQNLYPEALPTATFHGNTLLEPRTMFIIMKRFFF